MNFFRSIISEVEDVIIHPLCLRQVFSSTIICKSICRYLNQKSLDSLKEAIVPATKVKNIAMYHIALHLGHHNMLNLRGSIFHIINDQRLLLSHYQVNRQLICTQQKRLVHYAYDWEAHNAYPPPIEITRQDNYYSKTHWLPSINTKKYTNRSK